MKIFDLFSMSLKNLLSRKVRTLLTTSGVVIGTCSIVVMISLGIGINVSQEEMLSQMGDLTVIDIYNNGMNPGITTDKQILNDKLLEQIKSVEGVLVATPMFRPQEISMTIIGGKTERYTSPGYSIIGVDINAMEKLGFQISSGKFIKEKHKPYEIVVGARAVYDFTDTKKSPPNNMIYPDPSAANGEYPKPFFDIMKEPLKIKTDVVDEKLSAIEKKLIVTGVLKEDMSKGYESLNGVFMDVKDLKNLIEEYKKKNGIKKSKDNGYDSAKVKVTDIKYVESVEKAIKDMGFETYSMESTRKLMKEQTMKLQIILGGIGAISLFVAAIGITNTMIMSIYERTREIGIMKVLGCYVNNIRGMFLIESGIIGLMGGVIGMIISYTISFIINNLTQSMVNEATGASTKISVIPIWLVFMAMIFTTLIGIIAGFYPANRAVKISALKALNLNE